MAQLGKLLRWAGRQKHRFLWSAFWAFCGVALIGVWWVPKREIHPWRADLTASEELAAEDAVRRTLAQVLDAAVILTGLYLTWQNVRINREGKITDRFSKAIDQLGSEKLSVRVGGVYALERIDRDSEKDHWTIVEVLCAFVREPTREPDKDEVGTLVREPGTRTDVQAACKPNSA